MRIRMLRQMVTMNDSYSIGQTYDVDDKQGKAWCKAGVAMEDKSKDGPEESKTATATMIRRKTYDNKDD